ncbi:MAG: hypothetical protein ACHQ51_06280 [Elusimicrobiota bacterium]
MFSHIERTLVLACVGVAVEVLYTALTERSSGKRLIGYSYVWMFPVYALLYPGFFLLRPFVAVWSWPLRACLYAVLIMVFELLTGLILRAAVGEAPWEPNYRGKRWCVLGLVRLDYFPAWAAAALVFERAYLLIAR